MSGKLGTFITVKVDPADNDGFDVAPAIVVGEHEDGSLAVRVFAAGGPTGDTVRNYVGDDGEPFPYPKDGDVAPPASSPIEPGSAVPTVDQLTAAYTPEELAQLRAELDQLGAAQPPTTDGAPGTGV